MWILFFIPFAWCEEEDGFVVLPEEKVHQGDYFASGGSVEISGIVKGDVYAVGSQIIIDGIVEGDVIATGGTLNISGEVRGSVRLAGGQIELNGKVGRNATLMGGNIQLSPTSVIGSNAVITGGVLDIAGEIGGNATLTASNVRLSGKIGGNILAYLGTLRISSKAAIGGNVEYSSTSEAKIDPGAEIGGIVSFKRSFAKELLHGKWTKGMIFGSRFTGILMNFLFSFVSGLIFLKIFPRRLKGILNILDKRPWKAFWIGILSAILLPISCLILFVTILGFPFALALLAIGLLGFYAAKVFFIIWVSDRIFHKLRFKKNSLWVLFLGLLLFFLFVQIPFLGRLLSIVATLLGLGAAVLGRLPSRRKPKVPKV